MASVVSGGQIAVLVFAAAWVATGLVVAGLIVAKGGFPDVETFDGPAIDWSETFSMFGACIAGGPLWILLFVWLRRST